MDTIIHQENGKYLGQTKFATNLLQEALALCVKDVSGVAGLGKKIITDKLVFKGIKISRSNDSNNMVIDVSITVNNGYAVSDVAYRVQEAVINMASQLTTDKIDYVNVYVRGAKYGTSAKQK